MLKVIADAEKKGIEKLYSYVSKTAKGFYMRNGFEILNENVDEIEGGAFPFSG